MRSKCGIATVLALATGQTGTFLVWWQRSAYGEINFQHVGITAKFGRGARYKPTGVSSVAEGMDGNGRETGADIGVTTGEDWRMARKGIILTNGSDTVVTICIRGDIGKRTMQVHTQQSIWKTLERYGSGRYRFIFAIDGRNQSGLVCDPEWPVILSIRPESMANSKRFVGSMHNESVVLTYHRGDEFCRFRRYKKQYHGVKPDFVSYWDSTDRQSSWNVTSPTSVAYLPLGPQFTFRPVEAKEIIPPKERRYLLNFVAALSTSASRNRLARILNNPNRLADIASMTEFPGVGGEQNASWFFQKEHRVVTPQEFSKSVDREKSALRHESNVTEGGYLSSEDYREVLLQSIFTLCPSGHNPETYRLFEAAEAGSIPVVALNGGYKKHQCKESLLPLIRSNAPFVYVSSWSELYEKLATYAASPHLLKQKQVQIREWYHRFMTDVSARVEELLDARLRYRATDILSFVSNKEAQDNALKGIGLPVLVVGLNKAGTSTIRDYFRCGGVKTSHYFCGGRGRGVHCGAMIKSNIENGSPPLSNMPKWEVYAELNDHKACYFPQIQSLDELHQHYPKSTFILNQRNITEWVTSVKSWGRGSSALSKKLVECDLPGLPEGVGSKDEDLALWYKMHIERVRQFVAENPSHHLVEVSIDNKDAGLIMEKNFGINANECWGHSNIGQKKKKDVRSLGNQTCPPTQHFSDIPTHMGHRKVDWNQVHAPNVLPSEKVPAFLIIGAQKAGTTTFFKSCTMHPSIHRPKWKEFHYFAGRNMLDPDSDMETWKRNYRFLFGDATCRCPSCVTGEATPQYIRFPNTVIPMVQMVCPWVKIVALLRDPISRALSAFQMNNRLFGHGHKPSFEELVRQDFDKMEESGLLQNWTDDKGWVDFDSFVGSKEEENALRNYEAKDLEVGFSNRSYVLTSGIIFRGMYEMQLRQWVQSFGSENILVVNTDKDRIGPWVCNRFYSFIGLSPFGPQDHRNSTEKHSTKDYSSEMSNEMELKLKKFFSPYNRRLESLLGKDWAGDVWGY